MKFPWMQFYVNDWLTPNVGLCQPQTRGIWIEWLCQMHLLDRCGQITGTREQLAVLGRCTSVQVESSLAELTLTKTADVTFRNDVVTVVNRRMRREYLSRKNGAIRVKRHRSNVACNGSVTAHSYISESELEGEREPHEPPEAPPQSVAPAPLLEKKEGWQLRKDLRETTDPGEREAINAELKRRQQVNRKPSTPKPAAPPKPAPEPIPFEMRKVLWEKAKKEQKT